MPKLARSKVLMVIVAVVIATYSSTIKFGFLEHDDDMNVVRNPFLQHLTSEEIGQLWRTPYLGLYIPVTYTYWAGWVAVSRQGQDPNTPLPPNPAWFHGSNLALHAINGYLVWLLLCGFGASEMMALIAALFFVLHPIQVEAVAWISGAKDLLSTAFALASALLFQHFLMTNGKRRIAGVAATLTGPHPLRPALLYLCSLTTFALAILAKPSIVAVPVVLLLMSLTWSARPIWQRIAVVVPQFVCAILIVLITVDTQVAEGAMPVVAWWQRPLVAGDTIWFYIKKIILPFGFAVDYARRPDTVSATPWLYLTAGIPVLTGLALLSQWRRWGGALIAYLAFCALLLPNAGFFAFAYQFISTVADRYAYMAMIAVAFAISRWPVKRWTRSTYAVSGVIIALLGVKSYVQAQIWQTEKTLFAHSLEVEPNGILAMVGLGNDAAKNHQMEDSIKYFRQALDKRPEWARVHNNLGNSYIATGHLVEATDELKKAIALFPNYPLAYNNLCGALASRELWDEAAEACLNTLRLEPNHPMSYQNMGYIAAKRHENDKAEAYFRTALQISPGDLVPRRNLGHLLKIQGKTLEAIQEYETLHRMLPDDLGIVVDLANLYLAVGAKDKARALFQAFPLNPSDDKARITINAALEKLGN